MKTLRLPHTDLTVSRIGYGIAMMDLDWRDRELVPTAVRAIRTAHDQGITFFDTADVYGMGRSDIALSEAIRESPGLRQRIVIQSKCGARINGEWTPGEPIRWNTFGLDLSRDSIVSSVEGTLRRLNTDYLDLLLLHAPDLLVEPEEVALAFDDLHGAGKVRYFGVSSHNQLQMQLLQKHIRQRLVTNQIHIALADYSPITHPRHLGAGSVVDYCRISDIQVQSFAPLRVDSPAHKASSLINPPADASPALTSIAKLLTDLAIKKGTNASAVALAWLMTHPACILPVVGASKPEYIVSNCAADRVMLDREEWHELFHAAAAIQPGSRIG